MANKIFRINIDGRTFWAKYFNKRTAKKVGKTAGWEITLPTGWRWFDDTIPNMKRNIKRNFPTATFTKIK